MSEATTIPKGVGEPVYGGLKKKKWFIDRDALQRIVDEAPRPAGWREKDDEGRTIVDRIEVREESVEELQKEVTRRLQDSVANLCNRHIGWLRGDEAEPVQFYI